MDSNERKKLEKIALQAVEYRCKKCGKWFHEKDFVIDVGLCKGCFLKLYDLQNLKKYDSKNSAT